jgi:hypothetical protein
VTLAIIAAWMWLGNQGVWCQDHPPFLNRLADQQAIEGITVQRRQSKYLRPTLLLNFSARRLFLPADRIAVTGLLKKPVELC